MQNYRTTFSARLLYCHFVVSGSKIQWTITLCQGNLLKHPSFFTCFNKKQGGKQIDVCHLVDFLIIYANLSLVFLLILLLVEELYLI